MLAGDPEAVAGAVAFHQRHGTTTTLASLVTAPVDDLLAAIARIAEGLDGSPTGQLVGIHLEGPFLSTDRCGAQNPRHMIDPDPATTRALLDAGRGHIRMVTVAPERPGALDLVAALVAEGVIAAVGHTDADHEQVAAAIDAGATVATHLGNGMRPFHHREPGPIGTCLADGRVACELIVDGHHLHPGTVRLAAAAKGPDGVVLITDATSAAGAGDGTYRVGRLDVEVRDGVARLAGHDTLAGSTLTMDAAVRNAVAAGLSLSDASRAASLVPARLLGISDRTGSIAAGRSADLVVLDDDLSGAAVVARGETVVGHDVLES
jgi:N-acetylglucosamine-6-phosphate deacetylase